MSRSTYTKPYPCIKSERSGKQYVTISKILELGKEYYKDGHTGVLVRFENESIVHEEIYYIGGYNYSKYLKLLKEMKCSLSPDKMLNEKCWIVIKHIIAETRKVKLMSVQTNEPNVPLILEEYE